jgi:2-octaprenylphenol hydroxylase
MEVWEERGTRAMEFDAADLGRAELGWIVENGPLCVALWERLERMPGVSVVAAGVTAVQPAPGPASDEIRLIAGDRTLAVRLLLAADGAASTVRRLLDVAVRSWDVGHAALATAARFERPHEGAAYQRFLLDGPVALLPTAVPDTCSVIWSQSPEQARRRAALDDAAFAAELERALQHRLGAVTALDRRITFPLQQQLAASFNPHPRVLLLGDAARVVHPLAGLGANLGLEDVRAVLTGLGASGRCGDPGGAGRWRAFDRRRTARSRLMLDVMLGLRHVYARGDPLSQWLRNVGVDWLNRAAPVKRQIMLEALGLGPVASS